MGAIQQVLLAGTTSAASAYLDGLGTTPRAAHGLDKLISTATNCLRVRRSSDNAEQDIGFAGAAIDTTALASFVGANNGFVVKLYDQTGNGEDLENATAASQPQVVSSGSYLGFISFNGTNQFMKITSLTLGTPQVGIYSKNQPTLATVARVFCELTTDASANSGSFLIYNNVGAWFVENYNSAGANRARRYATDLSMAQWTYLFNRTIVGSGEILAYKDGAARTVVADPATTEQTGNFATNDMYLGARAGTSSFGAMNLNNFVLYNADTSSIRSSIEAIVA